MAVRGTHHRLIVWQEAMTLAEVVCRCCNGFPRPETFALGSQMRRAAISIPSNIAEGAARHSSRELFQFLSVAQGSLAELETQVELARRLGYLRMNDELDPLLHRVAQLLIALRRSIKKRIDGAA